ncbi:MAG: hypothetical protein ACAI44_03320 [Candidatus Sericytochromatia bacterium]
MKRFCSALAAGAALLSLCACPSPNGYYAQTSSSDFPLEFEAHWSPDGGKLALFVYPSNPNDYANPRVYLLDARTYQIEADWEIRNPGLVAPKDVYSDRTPYLSWAADGRSLSLLQQSGHYPGFDRLYLHTLKPGSAGVSSRAYNLPLRFNDKSFGGYSHPALAPDQRSVALFEHQPAEGPGTYYEKIQLMRLDLETQALQPLGQALKANSYSFSYATGGPVWAPDQTAIYLLYVPATPDGVPEGTAVVYNERTFITRIPISGGQAETLFTPDQASLNQLLISPEGQYLLGNVDRAPEFSEAPVELGPQYHMVPSGSLPQNGLVMLMLEPAAHQGLWFTSDIGILDLRFWHGNHQIVGEGIGQINEATKTRPWVIWDVASQKPQGRYLLPDLHGLKPGPALDMAPFPARQLAMALYNPCCSLKNLRTGVYVWDMESGGMTRVGPDIARLMKDFPGVGLHDRSQYDYRRNS